jgi:hypothetical protein
MDGLVIKQIQKWQRRRSRRKNVDLSPATRRGLRAFWAAPLKKGAGV